MAGHSTTGGRDVFIGMFSDHNVIVSILPRGNGCWRYECWDDLSEPSFEVAVPAHLPVSAQLNYIETELRLRGLRRGDDT